MHEGRVSIPNNASLGQSTFQIPAQVSPSPTLPTGSRSAEPKFTDRLIKMDRGCSSGLGFHTLIPFGPFQDKCAGCSD